MRRSIRVLFFCHRADRTGAPLCLADLVGALDRSRFEPVVILGEDGPMATILEKGGVTPIVLPRKWQRGPLQSLALRKIIREQAPDVVQLSSAVGWTKSAALAAFSLGVPRVWHLHDDFRVSKYRRRLPWVRRLSNEIVACSESIAQAIPSPKTRVIPNGVSPSFARSAVSRAAFEIQHGLSPSRFRFVFVGAMMPHKSVHLIVEAANGILERFPETEFLLVGGTENHDYEAGVRALRDESPYRDRLFIWGETDDAASVINAADAVLLPSTRECFPRVVLEAAACQKPVLATPVGDVKRLIESGHNGFIVTKVDCAEALQESMAFVRAGGKGFASEVGRRAFETIAQEYSMKRYADAFAAVWERAASSRMSHSESEA